MGKIRESLTISADQKISLCEAEDFSDCLKSEKEESKPAAC